ncbi:MAG: thiazole synthase [Deltaproteobacteria bacterium]|jgi:thiazole synthase|nr:thiazole synthase [Deltaproteobacteria bacterium]
MTGVLPGDELALAGRLFGSRLILGSGKHPIERLTEVVEAGGVEIVTLALRRANLNGPGDILDHLPPGRAILPNTSGARTAKEALTLARLARELGCGDLIKIEVIADSRTLLPDNEETLQAVALLSEDGFAPLAYMTPDPVMGRKMEQAGAAAVMPLGAPIGSNRGLTTKEMVKLMVECLQVPVIVDAGLGRPSQACEAMELGVAAVMVNTAVATSDDPPAMAKAFALAVQAGRAAYLAGLGPVGRPQASSPLTGFLWEEKGSQDPSSQEKF